MQVTKTVIPRNLCYFRRFFFFEKIPEIGIVELFYKNGPTIIDWNLSDQSISNYLHFGTRLRYFSLF